MSSDPPSEQSGGYIPKGVRFYQKAIKHRDDALKKEERERKRTRDQQIRELKKDTRRQLLSNIEEIDSELLARISEMREDQGLVWDCGAGPRGEALLTLLYDHYLIEGLMVRVETFQARVVGTVCTGVVYQLRLNIPEVAEYQKQGRERWQAGCRR